MENKQENKASLLIDKLMKHYEIFTISELGVKIGVSQPYISAWKTNNNVKAIMKKCKKLGIYNEIFTYPEKEYNLENDDLTKYFNKLKIAAMTLNKENDLLEDLKQLMEKYEKQEFPEETS